jgi:hypothetical protein
MAQQVMWRKCGQDGHYCDLQNLDLSGVSESGVYVIWHEGNPSPVVRVGQGDVAARLSQHRNDRAITAYSKFGKLRVTWAAVSVAQRGGVERWLADQWQPLVGDAFPDVTPIAVNSPFAA